MLCCFGSKGFNSIYILLSFCFLPAPSFFVTTWMLWDALLFLSSEPRHLLVDIGWWKEHHHQQVISNSRQDGHLQSVHFAQDGHGTARITPSRTWFGTASKLFNELHRRRFGTHSGAVVVLLPYSARDSCSTLTTRAVCTEFVRCLSDCVGFLQVLGFPLQKLN